MMPAAIAPAPTPELPAPAEVLPADPDAAGEGGGFSLWLCAEAAASAAEAPRTPAPAVEPAMPETGAASAEIPAVPAMLVLLQTLQAPATATAADTRVTADATPARSLATRAPSTAKPPALAGTSARVSAPPVTSGEPLSVALQALAPEPPGQSRTLHTETRPQPGDAPMNLPGFAAAFAPTPAADATAFAPAPADAPIDLRHPQGVDQLGAQLLWAVDQDLTEADLHVHPRELGPISVRIELVGDQTRLWLTSAHAVTRDWLDAALPQLQTQLQGAGLNLVQAEVSDQHRSRPGFTPMSPPAAASATPAEVSAPVRSRILRVPRDGGIDDYA